MKILLVLLSAILITSCGFKYIKPTDGLCEDHTDSIPIESENPFPEDCYDYSYDGTGWYEGYNWIEFMYFENNDISRD